MRACRTAGKLCAHAVAGAPGAVGGREEASDANNQDRLQARAAGSVPARTRAVACRCAEMTFVMIEGHGDPNIAASYRGSTEAPHAVRLRGAKDEDPLISAEERLPQPVGRGRSSRPQLGHGPGPNLLTPTANFAPFVPAVSTLIAPSARFGRRAFLLSASLCATRWPLAPGRWGEEPSGGGIAPLWSTPRVALHRVSAFAPLCGQSASVRLATAAAGTRSRSTRPQCGHRPGSNRLTRAANSHLSNSARRFHAGPGPAVRPDPP
jgi:hypothetical protein